MRGYLAYLFIINKSDDILKNFSKNTMKQLSNVAQCAKMIRKDLKTKYPNIKFLVKSKSYSMGNSITVEYQGEANIEEVKLLLSKYEEGHFDSMNDIYEYDNANNDIPQTKYLFVQQILTDEQNKHNLIVERKEFCSSCCGAGLLAQFKENEGICGECKEYCSISECK